MKIDFRQGIVRYQLDPGTSQPIFLQQSNGGTTIDLIVSPNPTIVTIASEENDFLVSENKTILEAFSGFVTGTDYWLYIDINLLTAERTFGSTTLEPFVNPSQPASPQVDQHWFDTTNMIMKVWTGSGFEPKLRVFLAKYDEGSVIQPYPLGSQVGNNTSIDAGFILFDEDDQPVRKYRRRGLGKFLTTETNFITHTSKSANVSFEVHVDVAKAIEPIPTFHLVAFEQPNEIRLASYSDPTKPIVGIVTEDFVQGEVGRYVTQGVIANTGWNFTEPPGTALFTGTSGEVTTSVPQTGAVQRIGFVLSPMEMYLLVQPPLKYPTANFSNLVVTQFDKVAGEFVLSNDVPGNGGGGNPLNNMLDGIQHVQSLASDTWTITHSRGTTGVNTQVFIDNKFVIPSDIEVIDINTIVVTFDSPQVGFANLTFFAV